MPRDTKVKRLYKTPFSYDAQGQWITDANGHRVLDVRGWGRIQYKGGAELQDAVGERIATILSRHWHDDLREGEV